MLDLFCGAGGAARGYQQAGFHVTGIDILGSTNYCGDSLIKGDVSLLIPDDLDGYDFIHASPPCQAHSNITPVRSRHEDLIPFTRKILKESGIPYVIENVVGAPLLEPEVLCGRMFDGLRVYRHRLFETNWGFAAPAHVKHDQLCFTMDKRKPHYGQLNEWTAFVQVTGGGNCTKAAAADAMGIDWATTKKELNEAIPPAYTHYIGSEWMRLSTGHS